MFTGSTHILYIMVVTKFMFTEFYAQNNHGFKSYNFLLLCRYLTYLPKLLPLWTENCHSSNTESKITSPIEGRTRGCINIQYLKCSSKILAFSFFWINRSTVTIFLHTIQKFNMPQMLQFLISKSLLMYRSKNQHHLFITSARVYHLVIKPSP